MKKKTSKRKSGERARYLKTDFGDALAGLEPLDLDLEFPAPTQPAVHEDLAGRTPRKKPRN